MNDQYLSAIKYLPQCLTSVLASVDDNITERVTEIRIRSSKPLCLTINDGIIYPNQNGYSILPDSKSFVVSADIVTDTFLRLCNNSVYSHEEEISQGFLILKGGHRAGICGKVIKKNGAPWLTDISSINIRIAHEIHGVAAAVFGKTLGFGGMLICGPPNCGKTTLLRDYIRLASNHGERVVLVDCRGEIAAVRKGVCSLDVGINTDVITGGEKAKGIEQALRVMSPDIIAFDEIGTGEELLKIQDCFSSGTRIITTFHCESYQELLQRNRYLPLLDTNAFTHLIFLNKYYKPVIYKERELSIENLRDSGGDSILHGLRNAERFQAV